MWARKAKHSVELAVLPAIQARTLLVHNTGAALFDAESVRAAAKLIPDARCAELAARSPSRRSCRSSAGLSPR